MTTTTLHQVHTKNEDLGKVLKGSTLSKVLAGDICAATVSATLVAPVITAIDRAVVENTASPKHSLLKTLTRHLLKSITHPRSFYSSKAFWIVWTLYAATYTTANTVESTAKAFVDRQNDLLIGTMTFFSTCIVNVPLGVWKDVRYVQIYGTVSETVPTGGDPPTRRSSSSSTTPLKVSRPGAATTNSSKFPRIVGATFLFRDVITIAGSITLPPILAHHIPPTHFSSPAIKMATLQLLTPIFSQLAATPVHILGIDLYTSPARQGVGKAEQDQKEFGANNIDEVRKNRSCFWGWYGVQYWNQKLVSQGSPGGGSNMTSIIYTRTSWKL